MVILCNQTTIIWPSLYNIIMQICNEWCIMLQQVTSSNPIVFFQRICNPDTFEKHFTFPNRSIIIISNDVNFVVFDTLWNLWAALRIRSNQSSLVERGHEPHRLQGICGSNGWLGGDSLVLDSAFLLYIVVWIQSRMSQVEAEGFPCQTNAEVNKVQAPV